MKMGGADKFCLKWNDYEQNLNQAFIEIRESNDFLDVTLVCEDNEQMRAHKVILSACSTFFRALLQCNPHQHPLIYLRGVRTTDLQNILDFMYHGEVNVAQDELNSFLAVAEDLKIKGLTQNLSASTPTGKRKDFSPSRTVSPLLPQNDAPSLNGGLTPNPPNKRSRRDLSFSTNNLNSDITENSRGIMSVKSEPRDGSLSMNNQDVDYLIEADVSTGADDNSFDGYQGADVPQTAGYVQGYAPHTDIIQNSKGLNIEELANIHLRKSDVGPGYDCGLCNKRYRDRYNAQDHIECQHFPSFGRYECDLCGKKATSRKMHLKHRVQCRRSAGLSPINSPNDSTQGYVSEYYENKVISPNNTKGISEPIKINVRSTDDLQEIPRGHQNPPFQPFQDGQTCDERLDRLAEEHIERQGVGSGKDLMCKICGKINKDWTKAKSHLESIHFPTEGGYQCKMCGTVKNTKKALRCHERKCQ